MKWVTKKPFIRKLVKKKISVLGRSRGSIVVRHKSASVYKNFYYLNKNYLIWNLSGIIIALETNPSRRSFVSLVAYPIGTIAYVPSIASQSVGDRVLTGWKLPIVLGNSLPLLNIPLNIKICFVEAIPGSGAVYVKSPGNWAIILAKKQSFAKILFKNGRKKFLNLLCFATIGRVANIKWKFKKLKKAGNSRKEGWRPIVRGVAQNAVDHPHGGGKGKKSKNAHPAAPWGVRKKKKVRDKEIF